MKRRLLLAIIAPLLVSPSLSAQESKQSAVTPQLVLKYGDGKPDDKPLTISASCIGNFSRGNSWYLSVNALGNAALIIDTMPNSTIREFTVKPEQLATLRAAIDTSRFFELQSQYGGRVPDGSSRNLTITVGDSTKSIRLDYLWNYDSPSGLMLLNEVARALEVENVIRNWFDDEAAADLRPYDLKIKEASLKLFPKE